VRLDPVSVEPLVREALKDDELRKHISPALGKLSTPVLVNIVIFQFLTKWKERSKPIERN